MSCQVYWRTRRIDGHLSYIPGRTLVFPIPHESGARTWHPLPMSPLIRQLFEMARERHSRWVEASFADAIGAVRGAARERRTLLLFAATDFYNWKLYRWDLGKSREFTIARMLDLVTAVIRDFRRQQ